MRALEYLRSWIVPALASLMVAGSLAPATAAEEVCESGRGYFGFSYTYIDGGAHGRLVVTGVMPGSPAERDGLREGDEITAVNGARFKLDRRAQLFDWLRDGDRVELEVMRDGSKTAVDVKAECMPAELRRCLEARSRLVGRFAPAREELEARSRLYETLIGVEIVARRDKEGVVLHAPGVDEEALRALRASLSESGVLRSFFESVPENVRELSIVFTRHAGSGTPIAEVRQRVDRSKPDDAGGSTP